MRLTLWQITNARLPTENRGYNASHLPASADRRRTPGWQTAPAPGLTSLPLHGRISRLTPADNGERLRGNAPDAPARWQVDSGFDWSRQSPALRLICAGGVPG